jgi:nitrate/TMAO reductase-like tetraheme cytochrome c subunit
MEHVLAPVVARIQPEVLICRNCGEDMETVGVNIVPADKVETQYVTDGTECEDCYGVADG